jgi:hypothetical protein
VGLNKYVFILYTTCLLYVCMLCTQGGDELHHGQQLARAVSRCLVEEVRPLGGGGELCGFICVHKGGFVCVSVNRKMGFYVWLKCVSLYKFWGYCSTCVYVYTYTYSILQYNNR